MSLLINGMDMPKNGRVTIELASEETGTNILARITDDKTGQLIEHKGVVEISTPHGDLIDRGDVIEEINRIFPCHSDEYEWAYTTVEQADTIIEAEE